jgi:hypothetical protein
MSDKKVITVAVALARSTVAAHELCGWELMAYHRHGNRMTLWFARGAVLGEW